MHELPSVDPDAEGEYFVDPFFWVASVFVFTGNGFMSREAIWSCVFVSGNVYKDEVEKKDHCDPAINDGVRLDVVVA